MTDNYPPFVQREALMKFAVALKSASTAFRRDECSDPHIKGSRGHIYAVPGGFELYCVCESKQAWTWAKKLMAFATVAQDGDEEGMMFMDRTPTMEEAETLRSYLGVRSKPEVGEQEVERRRQLGQRLANYRAPSQVG